MTFLNPAVLLGLAAAAIPILLHFFNLRKLQTIDFSTLTFLKELQKTRIRRLKLTQLILLLLRVLVVVCAVLAFARPTIPTSFPGLGAKAKSSVVIILDNSFSMELADERGVRLKQAKEAALGIMRSLGDGDEVALIQMADLADRRHTEFSRDLGSMREAIQTIPTAFAPARLESALRLASSILTKAQNLNREVFIITDAQKNITEQNIAEKTGTSAASLNTQDSLALFSKTTAIYCIPIGLDSKAGERNLSVDSLNVVSKIFESGKPVEVEARVRNSGSEEVRDVIVSLLMNGERVAQRTVTLPKGESRIVPIAAVAPERNPQMAGLVRCTVEVEGDVLDADNRRHFGFVLPPAPRLAVIGSRDETSFLTLALRSDKSTANLTELPIEALSAIALNEFDAVFLVGIPRFSQSDAARLQGFVQEGGGLFVFAGANADLANYNTTLLPALQFGKVAQSEYPAATPAEFTTVDATHPLFQGVFKKNETAGTNRFVESPRIARAMPLVRESFTAQAIIDLADGIFLAESKRGSGKALYIAIPPSADWSNFPVTGVFVPIVFRAASYLTSRSQESVAAMVGEAVTIPVSGKVPNGAALTVTDPSNTESLRQAAPMPSGAILFLESLRQQGVYAISYKPSNGQGSGVILSTLSVNTSASESQMVMFSESEFSSTLEQYVSNKEQIRMIPDYRRASMDALRAGTGTELWRVFLICAVIAAIAEMLVARRAAGGA
jgi:hypothetical protein